MWDHFLDVEQIDRKPTKEKCKYCNHVFSCKSSIGTNHMQRHLKAICPRYKHRDKKNAGIELRI